MYARLVNWSPSIRFEFASSAALFDLFLLLDVVVLVGGQFGGGYSLLFSFERSSVETVEQEEEKDRLERLEHAEDQRPLAFAVHDRVDRMAADHHELGHLDLGHVLLPPGECGRGERLNDSVN